MLQHFFFNDLIFRYGFGERHPLKPERLVRMFKLLDRYAQEYVTPSELGSTSDLLRVHKSGYVNAVEKIDESIREKRSEELKDMIAKYGFYGDNPPFEGMYDSARAYAGASAAAARCVRDGAPLAFGIGGGLHHALADRASGFCIFNDCAIACSILRERFERVAYVDVDVHQGDGVQWIFYHDPTVLTCSIHESGRTLWPGTGSVEETGVEFTSLNVPVDAGTTREVWLGAFRHTILPALRAWKPGAIVLQMGADTHYKDPLAHVNSDQSAWLAAIREVQSLGLPIVALGGGGYNLTTVPRMWVSAILTLAGIPFEDEIPADLRESLGADRFSDPDYPFEESAGKRSAVEAINWIAANQLPKLAG